MTNTDTEIIRQGVDAARRKRAAADLIRLLARDDSESLYVHNDTDKDDKPIRPGAARAFERIRDQGDDLQTVAAIAERGDRADEVYEDEWDRILHLPRPTMSERDAKERWADVAGRANPAIDPCNEHRWESLAYGFFLAIGFNPLTAQRLAGEVA